jgi:Fur family ferric uptake transcriptional regulator
MTRQRMIILEALQSVASHPTANEIFELARRKLPSISLGTVYRNLDILAEGGKILCLNRAGAQKRFDGAVRRHHHVRCTACGRVSDIFDPPEVHTPLPEKPVPGFSIHGVEVEYLGLCLECEAKQRSKGPL